MTRRMTLLVIVITIMFVLAAGTQAPELFMRQMKLLLWPKTTVGLLSTVTVQICTPSRGQFEVMPLDFVGPPKPFPWPREAK